MNINKSLASLLIGLNVWGTTVVLSASHAITSLEWMGLGGVLIQAFGVYQIANGQKPVVTLPAVPAWTPIGGVVEQQPVPPLPDVVLPLPPVPPADGPPQTAP